MGDAAEQAQAEEQLQDEGGGKSKLPFILAGLAVFLIIVVAIAFMLFSGSGDGTSVVAEITKAPAGYNYTFPEPFTTNLAPPDDQYIFSTTITLELKASANSSESEMLAELGVDSDSAAIRMPAVMDAITGILASKTRQEVNSAGGRNIIRTEIKKGIDDILEKGEVMNVYLYKYSTN